MDSTVEVALAAKLSKLFPSDKDSFLSFPLTGLAFAREELDFLDDPIDAAAIRVQTQRKAQFARLLNLIPSDAIVYSASERFLWAEYAAVLRDADLAENVLSPNETKALKQAKKFLTDVIIEDGVETVVYSSAVMKYYECKTAYEDIKRIYLDEELTAEESDNPEEKASWSTTRKPQLVALEEKALADWMSLGQKEEVENQQEVLRRLSGRQPRLFVRDLMNDLAYYQEPDLLSNDPIGTYSTFYSPSNCFDPSGIWPSFRLTRPEIQGLLREAPPEIRKFAQVEAGDIESVAIEYAKVVVMRPWFNPDFFGSRYWKLSDREGAISDGSIPRSGRIPAFVTNMIVTRKVSIERLVPKAATGESQSLAAHVLRFMQPALLQVNQKWKVAAGNEVQIYGRSAITRTAAPLSTGGQRTPTVDTAGISSNAVPPAVRASHLSAKIHGTTVRRPTITIPAFPAPPAPSAPVAPSFERVTEEVILDGVAVLGFVCRRLPKSPDPDSDLEWET